MTTSEPHGREPLRTSKQAPATGLRFGTAQGFTNQQALRHMLECVAADGRQQIVDDYRIGYVIETAQGQYVLEGGELHWSMPPATSVHLEVVVCDAADGRFIPGLQVMATLYNVAGMHCGTHELPFVWHPWLFRYGYNWPVSVDGEYTLHVHIAAPSFLRHDKVNGKRFERAVDVAFRGVQIASSGV
jgi:hypothetical protein